MQEAANQIPRLKNPNRQIHRSPLAASGRLAAPGLRKGRIDIGRQRRSNSRRREGPKVQTALDLPSRPPSPSRPSPPSQQARTGSVTNLTRTKLINIFNGTTNPTGRDVASGDDLAISLLVKTVQGARGHTLGGMGKFLFRLATPPSSANRLPPEEDNSEDGRQDCGGGQKKAGLQFSYLGFATSPARTLNRPIGVDGVATDPRGDIQNGKRGPVVVLATPITKGTWLGP